MWVIGSMLTILMGGGSIRFCRRKMGLGHQSVFFETTGQELDYPVLKLRVHQDWRNGKWVSSKKTKRNAVR
ncbi:hypothetical protein RchiOBHm_Chr3g0484961 [Rosa chinensis]|uniref:Uncharacterized protein n=1 Tax=Rosa chinensis TaxID=74649 RepID=A0A2P6REZ0_ROSCH|nr:hypothetical protein RchiOBHm_Chr3g0484961 [Rosa chinensis]